MFPDSLVSLPNGPLLRLFDILAGAPARGVVSGRAVIQGEDALALAMTCKRLFKLFTGASGCIQAIRVRHWRPSRIANTSVRARYIASMVRLGGHSIRELEIGDLFDEKLTANSWDALLAYFSYYCKWIRVLDAGIPRPQDKRFRLPFIRFLKDKRDVLKELSFAASTDDALLAVASATLTVSKLHLYDIGPTVTFRALHGICASLNTSLSSLSLEGASARKILDAFRNEIVRSFPKLVPALKELDLNLPVASLDGVGDMITAVGPTLSTISLRRSRLPLILAKRIAALCSNLSKLSLIDCDVRPTEFTMVFSLLGLHVTHFASHYRGSLSSAQLVHLARSCPKITSLGLRCANTSGFSESGIVEACTVLGPKITSFSLRAEHREVRLENAAKVVSAVADASNGALQELRIETHISVQHATRLLRDAGRNLCTLVFANPPQSRDTDLEALLRAITVYCPCLEMLDLLPAQHLLATRSSDARLRVMLGYDCQGALSALDALEARNPCVSTGSLRHELSKAVAVVNEDNAAFTRSREITLMGWSS